MQVHLALTLFLTLTHAAPSIPVRDAGPLIPRVPEPEPQVAPVPGAAAAVAASANRQYIPAVPKPPGSFYNGAPEVTWLPPNVSDPIPPPYQAFDGADIPMYRTNRGKLMLYEHPNDPNSDTAVFGSQNDDASQTACGIPVNAYEPSQVSIHPYWLKYAGLDRYCMQHICISMWTDLYPGSPDMMLKVTDICSTDPNNPTACLDPQDIKIDRRKAATIFGTGANPVGNVYPNEVRWFFTVCLDDGLVQDGYKAPSFAPGTTPDEQTQNWFSDPPLPNNIAGAQDIAFAQYFYNQAHYPALGWQTYQNGGYSTDPGPTWEPISDWQLGDPEPVWAPIAGGTKEDDRYAQAVHIG